MRTSAIGMVVIVGIAASACVQKSIVPTSFTPSYKPMIESSEVTVARGCAALSTVNVENGLKSAVVGRRTLESSSFPAQTITMDGDLVGWVRSSAKEVFSRAMLKTSVEGAPSVTLRLADIQIDENVHVNAGYDGRVSLDASVVNAYGKECWSGRKSGGSQDYGDHGSAVNYRSTVDHALDRAVMAVAADPGFQEALCSSSCRNDAPPPPPAPKKKSGKRSK